MKKSYRLLPPVGMKRMLLILGMLCVPLVLIGAGGATTPQRKGPPNIVLIVADDMGYGDLGVYGHPSIQTPHLDRMAEEGMKFTQFYVGASTCTPSRAALLTGRYPIRSGLSEVLIPSSSGGLPASEVTLAEALKAQGYATGIIGKWHLGSRPEYLPLNHGFDYYFGVPYSNDMSPDTQPDNPLFADSPPTPIIRNFDVINDQEPDHGQFTRLYTEEAIGFMRQYAGKQPFLLYLAHTMPHVPLGASEAFRGKSRAGLYGDVIEEIDASTGAVLRAIDDLGITNHTLVLFTSDNGPWLSKKEHAGSAGPFREGKVSTWEGGYRVPAIVRWPGKIPAGVTTSAFATTMDVFTTSVLLAGGALPQDREIDGQDLSHVLIKNGKGRDPELLYYFGEELWAYRFGSYKIHFKTTEPASVQKWGDWPVEVHDPPLLYNVEVDPSEKFNIAGQCPDLVEDLVVRAKALGDKVRPGELVD